MFETIFLGFLAQAAFNSLDIETPFDKAWKNKNEVVEMEKPKSKKEILKEVQTQIVKASSNDEIEWVIEVK